MVFVCPAFIRNREMAWNLKNPHLKDNSSSKSEFMSGLQHAVYNMNPEKAVMTWQFLEFYFYQHQCLSENRRFLHASWLRQYSVTCPASFGSLLRHIISVLPLTGLLRRPKLNTWVRSWVRTNTLKINTSADICSLRRRCNLILVSNVSEAALISACSGSPTDSRNYRNAFLIFFLSFVT